MFSFFQSFIIFLSLKVLLDFFIYINL